MTYLLAFIFFISLIILIYFTYYPYKSLEKLFKLLTSLLFIGICISGYGYSNNSIYFIFIILGLTFSLLGDVFLAFVDGCNSHLNKCFIHGLLSFSVAHLFFSIGFIFVTNLKFTDILITSIISISSLTLLNSIKNFDFKGRYNYVVFYAVVISFMLVKSLSILNFGYSSEFVFIIITGALLFVVSDLILSFVYFYNRCPHFMSGLNLLVYYVAQLFIALSVYFI